MQASKNIARTTMKLVQAYAVLEENGYARRCQPTEAEIAAGDWKPGGKVVFAGEREAQNFANGLRNAGGPPQTVYECPRRGHWHITTRERV